MSRPKKPIKDAIEQALHLRRIVQELHDELPDSIRRQFGWVDRSKH